MTRNYENLTVEDMEEILVDEFDVSSETIDVVSNINGWSEKTMTDILYAVSGYNFFGQWKEDE